MDYKIKLFDEAKNISDLSRKLFNNDSTKYRELAKKELKKYKINYSEWIKEKKEKRKKYCLCCGKELNKNQTKFCCLSCAATFNNAQRYNKPLMLKEKNKQCLHCGNKLSGKQTKFCSFKCQWEHEYINFIQKWQNGEIDGCTGKDGYSKTIKRYLLEKFEHKCQICGWGEVNQHTNKIPLQIHHIDGDCTNNKEENLQLLCPNCHSLTENYGHSGKHKSNRLDKRLKHVQEKIKNYTEGFCVVCGKKLNNEQIMFCSNECCQKRQTKNITKEDILNNFKTNNNKTFLYIAQQLGISTTTLRRRIKEFNIIDEVQQLKIN